MSINHLEVENILFHTVLQLVFIFIASRLCSAIAKKVGQPQVIGEIIAGLLLGPSLFGSLFPKIFDWVFPSNSSMVLNILSQIGLIFLMFQIGLEFDFSHLQKQNIKKNVFLISAMGILFPFALGWLFGEYSHSILAPTVNEFGYKLFIGTAMSITAIPILGRIMMELNLTQTKLGAITISSAAIDDILGWTILMVITALVTSNFSKSVLLINLCLLIAYLIFCLIIVRKLLLLYLKNFPIKESLTHNQLTIFIVVIFLSSLVTFKLGIFTIFGGFIIGTILHDQKDFKEIWNKQVAEFITVFFLPIFFTYVGLRTKIGVLSSPDQLLWCIIVIALATLGKFGGCYLASRISGLDNPHSIGVGIMMNTRALMELIVINIGRDLGVIPNNLFTMLVIMAIFTTIITSPILKVLIKKYPTLKFVS